jgi:aspartyl-tRNA(Asn)/glutamyl-tRNA(Gln) amidotransferase subunit A
MEESAKQIRDGYVAGEGSAVERVDRHLKWIHQRDEKVKAYLAVLDERVRHQAERLDEKRARGEKLGKLAGVPISVKDNMQLKGTLTTCASKFLSNYRSPYTATAIELLEAEDALIVGKCNLDEFAMGSSNEHSAYSPTYNPWDLKRTPGGSSGGSAAAVAARMTPLSLGSDTGGSIRQPAGLCGIVGFKPTYGRVSRYGLVAFGSSLDQIGPFATNCDDIGLIMEVMGQHDPKDSTSLPAPAEDYASRDSLEGVKVGVPYALLEGLSDDVRANFDASLETMKSLGAEVIDLNLDLIKYGIAVYYILATAEASTNLARFDGVRYGVRSPEATSLDEIYDLSKDAGYGDEVKRRIMLGTYVLSAGYQDAYYRKAQRVRTRIIDQFSEGFNRCDVVALPTSPVPAFELGAVHDPLQMYLLDIYTVTANLAGLPAISVPSGFSKEGLPLGLQLMGPQRGDVQTVAIAGAYEKAAGFSAELPPMVKEAS